MNYKNESKALISMPIYLAVSLNNALMGFYQLTTETIAVVKLKAKQQAARIMFVPNNGIDRFNDNQVKLPSFMFYISCF